LTNPKGTQLETAAVRWFREHGWVNARRIVKEGTKDKGDVTLGDGIPCTIECKNTRAINIAGGQKELATEMENAGNYWGFTIHKKRGTTDVGEYYAVLPVAVLNAILRQAVPAGDSRRMPPRQPRAISKTEAMEHALATETFVERTKRTIPRRP
jgi:hypothetical protein